MLVAYGPRRLRAPIDVNQSDGKTQFLKQHSSGEKMQLPTIELDIRKRTCRIGLDGQFTDVPFPDHEVFDSTSFSYMATDFSMRTVTLRGSLGVDLVAELGYPGGDEAMLANRPVVYLDQLHWVTLARSLWTPKKLSSTERAAAETLIGLARQEALVLPISSANLVEATRTFGLRREQLATTILELSRGWKMRNPVSVRMDEISNDLRQAENPAAEGVFTLDPKLFFTEESKVLDTSGIPESLRDSFERAITIQSVYETMLEDTAIPAPEGIERATKWAEKHESIAADMAARGVGKQDAIIETRDHLLADFSQEIELVIDDLGLSSDEISNWIATRRNNGFGGLPYMGRAEAVLFNRLRNPGDQWHHNDLFDLNFLECAAAYADVVVGEKKTSHYLNREIGATSGAAVFAKLPAAVDHLEALLFQEKSEK